MTKYAGLHLAESKPTARVVAKTAMQVVERNSSCPDGESCPDPVSAALGGIGQVGEDTSGHCRHPRHIEAATTPPRAAPHPLLFSPTQPRLFFFSLSVPEIKSFPSKSYHPRSTNLESFKMSSTEQT